MKRSWYHVTDRHNFPEWEAVCRPPQIKATSEPETPRLCVSGTVAQALSAVWLFRETSVYITPPRRTVPPKGVHDAVLTGERWIIPPCKLLLLGTIPVEAIEWAQEGLEPGPKGQSWLKQAIKLERMVQVVAKHLPQAAEPWVGVFAKGCREMFENRLSPTD